MFQNLSFALYALFNTPHPAHLQPFLHEWFFVQLDTMQYHPKKHYSTQKPKQKCRNCDYNSNYEHTNNIYYSQQYPYDYYYDDKYYGYNNSNNRNYYYQNYEYNSPKSQTKEYSKSQTQSYHKVSNNRSCVSNNKSIKNGKKSISTSKPIFKEISKNCKLSIEAFLPCGDGGAANLTEKELKIRKLFIDKIPLDITSAKLYKKFLQFCDNNNDNSYIMEASIISNRFRTKSRGYGFVIFSNPDSAFKAIKSNVIFNGIKVNISYASSNPKGIFTYLYLYLYMYLNVIQKNM